MSDTTVVIVGQGYVGLPMAMEASASGLNVIGYDVSASVVDDLSHGLSHIDDIDDGIVANALERGYRATTDPSCIADGDIVVVCVPTPLADTGGPDLGAVEGAARTIGEHVRPGALVILESTTYPGTTEEVFAPLVMAPQNLRLDETCLIAFSPERVDPGNLKYGVRNTPKVVGGLTEASSKAAASFYETFIDEVVVAKGAREAEMAKLLENTFRHVNIALVNEMVRFCDELDIDLWNAIECAATKPFGFMPFKPGPGVGGHCIPIDPSYLSHRVKAKLGYAFRIVELAEEVNSAAPAYVAHRAWKLLNDKCKAIKGSKVVLLGVSYKPNISDTRESPALPLFKKLVEMGASVSYMDPHVPSWRPSRLGPTLTTAKSLQEALDSADVAILVQDHQEFDLRALEATEIPVLDTRGVLHGTAVERL